MRRTINSKSACCLAAAFALSLAGCGAEKRGGGGGGGGEGEGEGGGVKRCSTRNDCPNGWECVITGQNGLALIDCGSFCGLAVECGFYFDEEDCLPECEQQGTGACGECLSAADGCEDIMTCGQKCAGEGEGEGEGPTEGEGEGPTEGEGEGPTEGEGEGPAEGEGEGGQPEPPGAPGMAFRLEVRM